MIIGRCSALTLAVLAMAVASCDQRHSAESAGAKLDRASTDASRTIDRVGNDAAEKTRVAASRAAEALDDASVTTKVKAALFAEPGLKTLQLGVETHEGVVTLTGAVDTPVLRQRAIEIAGAMSGVHQVVDKLVVKS